mgnify:CR=1 FL=1
MSEPVYILGGYQTDFAKAWARNGQDISDMVREATQGVLEQTGLNPAAIGSIHVGNAFGEMQRQQAHHVRRISDPPGRQPPGARR